MECRIFCSSKMCFYCCNCFSAADGGCSDVEVERARAVVVNVVVVAGLLLVDEAAIKMQQQVWR